MSQLYWNFGTMNSGKSTLALQLDDTYRRCGRQGVLFTMGDRSGAPQISSRLGISAEAVEVTPDTNIAQVVYEHLSPQYLEANGGVKPISYVIADEVQFYAREHVDQLAWIVDHMGIDVHAFGLSADFTSTLFAGSARMFELADVFTPLPVQALCWCGAPGRMNARVVGTQMVTEGDQVVVGDVGAGDSAVSYTVLCRSHYASKETSGPLSSSFAPRHKF